MGLQPCPPSRGCVRSLDVVGNRLEALCSSRGLDFKPHFDRLPRFETKIDDLDLARTARLRCLLQGLINHRARCVGIVDAEHFDRLVVLGQLVDQVAGGPRREALRRHHRAIVPLEPAVLLERLLRAFLLDVENLVEIPCRALVLFDHQRAERDGLVTVRMRDRAARLAVHQRDFAVLVFVIGDDLLKFRDLQFLAESRSMTMGRSA